MSAELFPAAYEALMTAGALDVWTTSALMKKGRPATVLSVLATADAEARIAHALLRETTTLGVRVTAVQRYEAEREYASVQTIYGPVTVKIKRVHGKLLGLKPEYEECARLAQKHGVPVRIVVERAQAAANLEYSPGLTSPDMASIGDKLTI
jgi:uncharacterized protein (DUF111 family)